MRGVEITPVVYPMEDFSQDIAYSVLEIINGNTVRIEYGDKPTTIRFIGVEISEIPESKSVEEDSKEALVFALNLLLGESVYLRFDGLDQINKDGHLLAYLYRAPDELFVNLEIVRQGYGRVYTQSPFRHMELFAHYESRAREVRKGLWHDVVVGPSIELVAKPVESPQDLINLNTAGRAQLMTLRGVGPVLAQRIIDGRPYRKVEDVLEVRGIGKKTLAKFRDQLTVK